MLLSILLPRSSSCNGIGSGSAAYAELQEGIFFDRKRGVPQSLDRIEQRKTIARDKASHLRLWFKSIYVVKVSIRYRYFLTK